MALPRGRRADDKHRRIYNMLKALTSRSQGMTKKQLMPIMGLPDSRNKTTQASRSRMFERDMEDARDAGWHIDVTGSGGHVYVLKVVDHRLRAEFTPEEREQLLLAAERAGLGQLYEDLGAPADGFDERADDPALVDIQHAIKHRCRVRFTYANKSRDVHPYDVHFRRRQWLFRGREEGLVGHKHWYFQRLTDLSVSELGSADVIPELPDLNLDPLLWEKHPAIDVMVQVERPYVEQVVGLLGSRGHVIDEDADTDTVEVSFTVTNSEAFLHRLFELDERVQLVGPEQVRGQARDWLDSVVARRGQPVASVEPNPISEPGPSQLHPEPGVGARTHSKTRIVATGPGKLLVPELNELLKHLDQRPTLRTVARALGRETDEIRRHVAVMNDPKYEEQLLKEGLSDESLIWIEPVDDKPSDDDLVKRGGRLIDTIGTEMFDASVLGPLYVAAEQLLVEQPENEVLAAATTKLRRRFLPEFREGSKFGSTVARDLAMAMRERRAVRITYARAWEPGVHTRIIHPYVFEATSRGLEVDAEPVEKSGEVRSFLIGNIRDVEVLTDRFKIPGDVERRCLDNRVTETVAGFVPTARRWTIEKWAEHATFSDSDSDLSRFEAELLRPYEDRISLMMVMAGPRARLLGPEDELAGRRAHKLLQLHGL